MICLHLYPKTWVLFEYAGDAYVGYADKILFAHFTFAHMQI